jgi:hypothetical protein
MTKTITHFPNKAGTHADTNDILTAELIAAGIEAVKLPITLKNEVVTNIIGHIGPWSFERAWYYWRAKGPGIPIDDAIALHESLGEEVRVAGYAGGIDPRKAYSGFGVTDYHIDSAEGLKALADLIKKIIADNAAKLANGAA